MNVFVTGGSGFVGSSVLDALVSGGHQVKALRGRRSIDPRAGRVSEVAGDLFDPSRLAAAMAGCDAIVHLVGIISQRSRDGVTFERMHVEATRSVIDAARQAGVRRFLHMSALGAREDGPAEYHRTKARAEAIVRDAGLDATIFRPSMIHGPKGEFARMLAGWARGTKVPWVFMPYFGRGMFGFGGGGRLQPIHIDDVARAVALALERPETIGQTYDLVGPDVFTWPRLHAAAARAIVGKERMIRPFPAWYMKLVASFLPESLLGFNLDQVEMALEDNVADAGPMVRAFGFEPRGFEETLREYAKEIG